jgi:acyl carrier protein
MAQAQGEGQTTDIQRAIRAFIEENFLFGADSSRLTDTTSFLESGTIDSTGILEMIQFIESTYGVRVEDSEMLPQYLDSIDNVARFVEMKQGRARS